MVMNEWVQNNKMVPPFIGFVLIIFPILGLIYVISIIIISTDHFSFIAYIILLVLVSITLFLLYFELYLYRYAVLTINTKYIVKEIHIDLIGDLLKQLLDRESVSYIFIEETTYRFIQNRIKTSIKINEWDLDISIGLLKRDCSIIFLRDNNKKNNNEDRHRFMRAIKEM